MSFGLPCDLTFYKLMTDWGSLFAVLSAQWVQPPPFTSCLKANAMKKPKRYRQQYFVKLLSYQNRQSANLLRVR